MAVAAAGWLCILDMSLHPSGVQARLDWGLMTPSMLMVLEALQLLAFCAKSEWLLGYKSSGLPFWPLSKKPPTMCPGRGDCGQISLRNFSRNLSGEGDVTVERLQLGLEGWLGLA